jgi:hypothetical protein
MYHLLGLDQNLETVRRLAARHLNGHPRQRIEVELKTAYKLCLKDEQPDVPRTSSLGVNFVYDLKEIRHLLDFFRVDTPLNDLGQTRVIENSKQKILLNQARVLRRSRRIFDKMRTVCPEFGRLATLVINSILYAPSKGANGGTSSAAIGVIWINKLSQRDEDIMELFVHETSHTLMFIDELRYAHYKDYRLIYQKKNYARSAVLGLQRPLDKVLHSLVVATEVLLFRKRFVGHPKKPIIHPSSPKMIEQCLDSIESMRGMRNCQKLLAKRAHLIINKCESVIHSELLDDQRRLVA